MLKPSRSRVSLTLAFAVVSLGLASSTLSGCKVRRDLSNQLLDDEPPAEPAAEKTDDAAAKPETQTEQEIYRDIPAEFRLPTGRPRTKAEVLASINYAFESLVEEYPAERANLEAARNYDMAISFNPSGMTVPEQQWLAGPGGIGKSTLSEEWWRRRCLMHKFVKVTIKEGTINIPLGSILIFGRPASERLPGYLDGPRRVVMFEEWQNMVPLSELAARDERANSQLNKVKDGLGNKDVNPYSLDSVLSKELPSLVKQRLESRALVWDVLGNGMTGTSGQTSVADYMTFFQNQAGAIMRARSSRTYTAELEQLRVSAVGDEAQRKLKELQTKEKTDEDALKSKLEEVEKTIVRLQRDYHDWIPMKDWPFKIAGRFFLDPEGFLNELESRRAQYTGQESLILKELCIINTYNPRAQSAVLNQFQELVDRGHDIPADEINKRMDEVPQDVRAVEAAEIFGEIDPETGKPILTPQAAQRINLKGFTTWMSLPTDDKWRKTIAKSLKRNSMPLIMNYLDAMNIEGAEVKVSFEDAAVEGIRKAAVRGTTTYRGFNKEFGVLTRSLFNGMANAIAQRMLERSLKSVTDVIVGFDEATFEYIVRSDSAGIDARFKSDEFESRLPKQTNFDLEIRPALSAGMLVGEVVAGTVAFKAVPTSVDFDPAARNRVPILANWGNMDIKDLDFLFNEMVIKMAGYIAGKQWLPGVTGNDLKQLEANFIAIKEPIEALVRILKNQENFEQFKLVLNERAAPPLGSAASLQTIVPQSLRELKYFRNLSENPDVVEVLRRVYSYTDTLLRANNETMVRLRTKMLKDNVSAKTLTSEDIKGAFREGFATDSTGPDGSRMGYRGLAEIMEREPGSLGGMPTCRAFKQKVTRLETVRGKIRGKLADTLVWLRRQFSYTAR